MHALYLASVWLHILAAMAWTGGIIFLMAIVVPWLRKGDRAAAAAVLRATGTRFRGLGWLVFAVVLTTGAFNLWVRGVRLESFSDPAWRASPFGRAVLLKLAVFVVVLVLSFVHDFFVGPRSTRAVEADPRSPVAERLRRRASVLGRVTAALAFVLVGLGVVLVRGWP